MTTTKPEVKLPELPSDATVSAIAHYLSHGDVDMAKNLIQEYGVKCSKGCISAYDGLLATSQNEARIAEESLAKVAQQREDAIHAYEAGVFDAVRAQAGQEPIDVILHCPKCGRQHIDAPEGGMETQPDGTVHAECAWENPPHRSHLCHGCGHIWRPADVPTNGVMAIKTAGKADSPIAQQPAQAAVPEGWKLVPIEPTEEMLDALCANFTNKEAWKKGRIAEWKKMINAAPDSGEGS